MMPPFVPMLLNKADVKFVFPAFPKIKPVPNGEPPPVVVFPAYIRPSKTPVLNMLMYGSPNNLFGFNVILCDESNGTPAVTTPFPATLNKLLPFVHSSTFNTKVVELSRAFTLNVVSLYVNLLL